VGPEWRLGQLSRVTVQRSAREILQAHLQPARAWQGLPDNARHVISFHFTLETRVYNADDDVAGII